MDARGIVVKTFALMAVGGAAAFLTVSLMRTSPAPSASIVDAATRDAAHDAASVVDASDVIDVDAANDVVIAPSSESPLCVAFREAEVARLTKIFQASEEDAGVDAGHAGAYTPSCIATPNGAWAETLGVVSYSFNEQGEPSATGKWLLVHIASDGKRVTLGAEPNGSFEYALPSFGPRHEHEIRVLADYDGDGDPEVHVADGSYYSEGDDTTAHRIYTFKNGVIARYAPASAFNVYDVRDVDGDGLPDILISLSMLSGIETCVSTHDFSAFEWPAHATKDGTFDPTDAVAKKFVADRCARAGKELAPRPGPLSLPASAEAIVCARVAGRTPADIRAELVKACDAYETYIQMCNIDKPLPDPDLRCPEWFKTLPDLELPH